MKERVEIEEKYKWDLSSYCKNEEDFLIRLDKLKGFGKKMKVYENKLKDEKLLLEFWKKEDEYAIELNKLFVYVSCREDEDQRSSKVEELVQKIEKIASENSENLSFADVEVAKFSLEKLNSLLKNDKFKEYIPVIKDFIRAKKHMLSKKEEELLAGMSEFFGDNSSIMSKFEDADAKYEDVCDKDGNLLKLDRSTQGIYLYSNDRVLRKNTATNLFKVFKQHINFLSTNYISNVKKDCFMARKRKYKSALARSLYDEEVNEKVYKNLIRNINKNLKTEQRFFELKRKALGLNNFATYDIYAPVGETKEKKMSFKEAINVVKEALKPLGEEYLKVFNKALIEKWFDVYPNEGKTSGAYSCCVYEGKPMILLNFVGIEDYVSTIAHEFGHAAHSYYSMSKQPYHTCDYTIFVAEVASTVNEMLLARYNLDHAKNDKEKLMLINKILELVHATIFRQTMFSEFEEKVHSMQEKGEPLSKDKLCDLYLDLNKKYFGKKVSLCEGIECEWARVPHFFRSFYVYKYATGLICAIALSKKLLEKEDGALDRYLNFLSSGSSKPPVELLKDAGVDLENDKTYLEAFEYINSLLDEMEKLI